METADTRGLREQARALVEHRWFQRLIVVLILLNMLTLGLQTAPGLDVSLDRWLDRVDDVVVTVFVVEILLRIVAYGRGFFRNPWSLFDLVVVGISVLPNCGVLSILRMLRLLRLLRLVSVMPHLRVVVEGLISALPSMGAVSLLLGLFVYVASVIGTKLFGATSPAQFGDLGTSIFSLLQVTTLDSWHDVAGAVMKANPHAWIFFACFIVLTSYMVINLFLGVMVYSMEERISAENDRKHPPPEPATQADMQSLLAAVESLRAELRELKAGAQPPAP